MNRRGFLGTLGGLVALVPIPKSLAVAEKDPFIYYPRVSPECRECGYVQEVLSEKWGRESAAIKEYHPEGCSRRPMNGNLRGLPEPLG